MSGRNRASCGPASLAACCRAADDGEQLGDPGGDRLRVVADQHGAVLPGVRAAVRQPARPFPARLPRGVREQVEPQVVGTVQHGRLRHEPAAGRARDIPGPATPDHAPAGQRDGDRRVRDGPDDLPPVLVLLGIGQLHARGQVGRPDPEHQVVRVGAAPLPQPAPRPGGDRTHRGRIGELSGPFGALRFQRFPGVVLDPGLVLAVGRRLPGSGLAAVPALAQLAADQHDRAQPGHRQQVHLVQEVGHGDAHDQRDRGHQERERAALSRRRRGGELEPGGALGRQQPRRPVEVETGSRPPTGAGPRPAAGSAPARAASGRRR